LQVIKFIFLFILAGNLLEANLQSYTYTPSNKLSKTTYPDNTTESKIYDAMGNLESLLNRHITLNVNISMLKVKGSHKP
jgi:hypothetical protein